MKQFVVEKTPKNSLDSKTAVIIELTEKELFERFTFDEEIEEEIKNLNPDEEYFAGHDGEWEYYITRVI